MSARLLVAADGANSTIREQAGILATVRGRAVTLLSAAATAIWSTVTSVATVAMTGLGIAIKFALGPVGLIIIGIGLLVAGLIYAYKHSETFRDIVNGVFQAVKDTASAVFTGVVGFVKGAIDWIKKNWPLLLAILTGPFGLAVLAISKNCAYYCSVIAVSDTSSVPVKPCAIDSRTSWRMPFSLRPFRSAV